MAASISLSQPFWGQYGRDPQHSVLSTVAAQQMKRVLWTTPVDLNPFLDSNGDLPLHYASPLITKAGTIIVTVRTGGTNGSPTTNDTFRVEGVNPVTGAINWVENTDYITPAHDWTPPVGSAIDSSNQLFTPAAGGTVLVRANADSAAQNVKRICFFGIDAYNADPSTYNNAIKIATPITVAPNGSIFFGYRVSGSNPLNLTDGFATLAPNGDGTYSGTYMSALAMMKQATNRTDLTNYFTAMNAAPAISIDESLVYFVGVGSGSSNGYLFAADTQTLAPLSAARFRLPLINPPARTDGDTYYEGKPISDATACPMIGPDGDVYFGTWWSHNGLRGFLMHWDRTLTVQKPSSSFGWDDTPSVVPASAVPSYTGTSSYLLLTKYNYYDPYNPGANQGQNYLAVLDPNATVTQTFTGWDNSVTYQASVMKPILLVIGITPDANHPGGVREWCINSATIDPIGKCAIINSEDGNAYRWDFTTNKLQDKMTLAPPTGEPYTPTVVGPDGMCFAINNAKLAAMVDNATPTSITFDKTVLVGGNALTGTVTLADTASGPGAYLTVTSSNATAFPTTTFKVPSGASSYPFSLPTKVLDANASFTLKLTRYDKSITTATITLLGSGLTSFTANPNTVVSGNNLRGVVGLANAAPPGGRLIHLYPDTSAVSVPATVNIPAGAYSTGFNILGGKVAANTTAHVKALLDNTFLTQTVTVTPAVLQGLSCSPATQVGGYTVTGIASFNGTPPSAGFQGQVTYGALTSGPATVTLASTNSPFTFNTSAVSATTATSISISVNGVTKSANLTLRPNPIIMSIGANPTTVVMSYIGTATVTLDTPAPPGGAVVSITTNPSPSAIVAPASFTVPAGAASGSFSFSTRGVDTSTVQAIVATYRGKAVQVSVTVTPVYITSFVLNPATVKGGQSTSATITLDHTAGSPLKVYLASSNVNVTCPNPVTVPTGSNKVTFTIPTKAVSAQTQATIYATAASASTRVGVVLTINP